MSLRLKSIDSDLESLFNRLADDIATETHEQSLGQVLRSGPDARRAYCEFMELHSALHWEAQSDYVDNADQLVLDTDLVVMIVLPSNLQTVEVSNCLGILSMRITTSILLGFCLLVISMGQAR